jgi:hypothetical protein
MSEITTTIKLDGTIILSGSGLYGVHHWPKIDLDIQDLYTDLDIHIEQDGRLGGMIVIQYNKDPNFEAGSRWFMWDDSVDPAATIVDWLVTMLDAFEAGEHFVA